MLILVGGLILLFLFFWGAYKVKDGFYSCNQTYTNIFTETGTTKTESLTKAKNMCESIPNTPPFTIDGTCFYTNWKTVSCNSKEKDGSWKSTCSCRATYLEQ